MTAPAEVVFGVITAIGTASLAGEIARETGPSGYRGFCRLAATFPARCSAWDMHVHSRCEEPGCLCPHHAEYSRDPLLDDSVWEHWQHCGSQPQCTWRPAGAVRLGEAS